MKMHSRRETVRILALVAMVLLVGLGACGPAATVEPTAEPTSPEEPTAEPTSITVVQGSEPRSLNPTLEIGKQDIAVQNAVMDPLIYHNRENETIPWLATSWESLDPVTWRIQLREGVEFHNGEAFNAEAVAFTIEAYNASEGEGRPFYQYIDHTEIVDDHTIDIVTKEQNAVTPETLALMFVLPPQYYEEVGPEGFSNRPVGTGPFVFEEWRKGVRILVKANPDYWNGAPEIDEVVFEHAPEAATRVSRLLTGEADIISNLPTEMVDQVRDSDSAAVESVPSLRKIMVEFYLEEPPFDDVRVRRAANYAIDKDALIEQVLGGFAERRKGVILPGWIGYNPDALNSYDYNPDRARELLAEAGYGDGVTVDFWYPIGRYMKDEEVSEAIAGMLAEVGIDTRMHGSDIMSLVNQIHTQTLSGMHFFSVAPLYNDPDYLWRAHFWSEGLNQYAVDETTDRLIAEGVRTNDREERAAIYQELEQYIVNEFVPWIFLYDQELVYGVSNRVDWLPRPDEFIDLRDASVTQ